MKKRTATETEAFRNASVHIEGPETESHRISSDVLSRVITGFQDIAWILGFSMEDVSSSDRLQLRTAIKKRYMIEWGSPTSGSYVLPVFLPENPQIGSKISDILSAIAAEDVEMLKTTLPDSRLRNKLLEKAIHFLPKTGQNWQLKYMHRTHSVFLDSKSYQRVKKWQSESLSSRQLDEVLTIKGELLRIDFVEKQVEVRYPPTKRPLKCYYLPEVEDSILEGRKDLIEVTGKFVLDPEGHPGKLAEVSNIQPVDLSEMSLSKLEYGTRHLELNQPLVFIPTLDEETKQLYVIEDPSIGVHVFAYTREDLMSDLVEQIFFLWDTYGSDQIDVHTLAKEVLPRRNELQKRLREKN
jgi:hypothetical protein